MTKCDGSYRSIYHHSTTDTCMVTYTIYYAGPYKHADCSKSDMVTHANERASYPKLNKCK